MNITDDTDAIDVSAITKGGKTHCGSHGDLVTMIQQLCDEVKKLAKEVRTINLALIGNYDQRGWLSRVDGIESRLTELEARVCKNEEVTKSAAKSVLRWALTAIGSVIASAIMFGWRIIAKAVEGQ